MRKKQQRRLGRNFNTQYFKPRGVPLSELEEKRITFDELEVLRLRFIKALNQTQAAKKMGLSQSQYQRDLTQVMTKITQALIQGQAIAVEKTKR